VESIDTYQIWQERQKIPRVKEGGGQIEYEDEDPKIHREFETELAEAGAQCMMGSYHPNCAQSK